MLSEAFALNFLSEGNIESRENREGQISRNVELRNHLDLFSYIMHCKSFPGVETRHKNVDIVIVRQNTEGEYAMLEHEVFIPSFHGCNNYCIFFIIKFSRMLLELLKVSKLLHERILKGWHVMLSTWQLKWVGRRSLSCTKQTSCKSVVFDFNILSLLLHNYDY